MSIQKNKKGAEKILSVYWFAILLIVAGAIVYLVSSFYGKPYDVREMEARLLTDKIANCLSAGGNIKENWQGLNADNFLEECRLVFTVEDSYGWDDDQYYAEIKISDFDSGQSLNEVNAGNPNLKLDCAVDDKNFPLCLERSMYSIDKAGKQYKINIFAAVRKTEKNVQ